MTPHRRHSPTPEADETPHHKHHATEEESTEATPEPEVTPHHRHSPTPEAEETPHHKHHNTEQAASEEETPARKHHHASPSPEPRVHKHAHPQEEEETPSPVHHEQTPFPTPLVTPIPRVTPLPEERQRPERTPGAQPYQPNAQQYPGGPVTPIPSPAAASASPLVAGFRRGGAAGVPLSLEGGPGRDRPGAGGAAAVAVYRGAQLGDEAGEREDF